MGLGPVRDVSLSEARGAATERKEELLARIDPLEARRAKKHKALSGITFGGCADRYIASHQSSWKNPKHRQQWTNTLTTYVYPVFGDLTVGAVDTGLVVRVLEPIWTEKPETASRLRGRI